MRAYFFGNMYLSSIQQGIQAQHCTAEMFVKYPPIDLQDFAFSTGEEPPEHMKQESLKSETLFKWARDHKTTILLNGGEKADLLSLIPILKQEDNPYPWAHFSESNDALNCCLTCVGIILPEKMYSDEAKACVRCETQRRPGDTVMYQYDVPELSTWQFELIKIMSSCGMAR